MQERIAPLLLLALRSTGDPGAAALLAKADGERLAGTTGLARHLVGTGQTRPDKDLDAVRDALWALNSIQLWDQLVVQRGWAPSAYGEVLERLFVAAVLDWVSCSVPARRIRRPPGGSAATAVASTPPCRCGRVVGRDDDA